MMKDKNNKGWIKLHRSILEWEWWDDRNTRDIFIYCLLSAQHEGTKWKGITIGRGQLVVSLRQIAAKCKLSLREVRTAINHLISTHELTQQATHEYTLLTVCNYDYYQDDNTADDTIDDTADDTRPTHDRHTTDTHNKNDKNERNNINIPPYNPPTPEDSKPKRIRKPFVIPTPAEVQAYCDERHNGISGQDFCDFYEAKGWLIGRSPMKDWKSAVRTWEAKRKQDQPSQQPLSNTTTDPSNPLSVPSELERARANFKF